MVDSLATALPREQKRVRGVLQHYLDAGPCAAMAASMIKASLDRAEVAASECDVVQMMVSLEELKLISE
jgi:hypothetical protein